jgi:hypothetical protein
VNNRESYTPSISNSIIVVFSKHMGLLLSKSFFNSFNFGYVMYMSRAFLAAMFSFLYVSISLSGR